MFQVLAFAPPQRFDQEIARNLRVFAVEHRIDFVDDCSDVSKYGLPLKNDDKVRLHLSLF